jgi:hypothetical protein
VKQVQERVQNTLEATFKGNEFKGTQVTQKLREIMDKWDYMKLKSLCKTKVMFSKLKQLPTE